MNDQDVVALHRLASHGTRAALLAGMGLLLRDTGETGSIWPRRHVGVHVGVHDGRLVVGADPQPGADRDGWARLDLEAGRDRTAVQDVLRDGARSVRHHVSGLVEAGTQEQVLAAVRACTTVMARCVAVAAERSLPVAVDAYRQAWPCVGLARYVDVGLDSTFRGDLGVVGFRDEVGAPLQAPTTLVPVLPAGWSVTAGQSCAGWELSFGPALPVGHRAARGELRLRVRHGVREVLHELDVCLGGVEGA